MLKTKHARARRTKADWYSSKPRVHLDKPVDRSEAERLVTIPGLVAAHAFLPLISFQKRERRYRRAPGAKKPKASTKIRELAYPANRDGHVYAYYAELLGSLYEDKLITLGLEDAVIGYRKRACNIRLARDAFIEITNRGNCAAIALDIKGFFDNIDHAVLKAAWADLICLPKLPPDHYAVFRALTAYGKISRAELLSRLGLKSNTQDRDLPKPLCSITQFRNFRSSTASVIKLVERNPFAYDIPQGTPLSAMAANISMLAFDVAVNAAATACGASYRRYSDDILVLCSPEHAATLEACIVGALQKQTKTLKLNSEKTERILFDLPGLSLASSPLGMRVKPLQYLGFTFDGQKVRIRGGTLARYHRRMASSAQAAKVQAKLVQQGKLVGRDVVHKRQVLAKNSHLGTDNFVSGYVKRARRTMAPLGAEGIRRQIANHMDTLFSKLS